MKVFGKFFTASLLAAQLLIALPAVPGFSLDKQTADRMFFDADTADTAQNFSLAVDKYTALIKLLKQTDPENSKRLRAQVRLARLYVGKKDFDAAEPLYLTLIHTDRAVLLKDPEVMIDLDDLSDAYIELEKDPHFGLQSLKHTQSLRELMDPSQPHLPEIYLHLARYYLGKLHDPKTAALYAEKLVAFDRRSALRKKAPLTYDLVLLASIYATMKDYSRARSSADEGLKDVRQCNCGKESITSFNEILHLCDLHDKPAAHTRAANRSR